MPLCLSVADKRGLAAQNTEMEEARRHGEEVTWRAARAGGVVGENPSPYRGMQLSALFHSPSVPSPRELRRHLNHRASIIESGAKSRFPLSMG